MKVFWAVLLVLVLGSVAYLTLGKSSVKSTSSQGTAMESARTQPPPPLPLGVPNVPPRRDNDEAAFFPAETVPPSSSPIPPAPSVPAPAAPLTAEDVPGELPKAPPATATPDPQVPDVAESPETPPVELVAKVEADADKKDAETSEPSTPAPAAAAAPVATPAPAASASAGSGVTFGDPPKIVQQDDGSMMVDDKYALKGEGTAAKPYEITWEYLVSAQEDYQPRLGKKKLPGRMQLLAGKHVKITGFVAFPIMAAEPNEMLAMLNQWDGCCIGIPPTPYDAIEVKLKEPASNDLRMVTYGTVEGKLTVEPYLVRDWLVSLYSIDGATMTRAQ